MSNKYVWGKVEDEWYLLLKEGDIFYKGNRIVLPIKVHAFILTPGMRWRHKHCKAVVRVLDEGHTLYRQDTKENMSVSLTNILYVHYNPLFNPMDYIKNG